MLPSPALSCVDVDYGAPAHLALQDPLPELEDSPQWRNLDHAIERRRQANQFHTVQDLIAAIEEGAVLRVRPKAMTVAVIIAGLLPIMLGGGTGSEVMRRIAAPMVGGMITAPMLSMLVLPAAYLLIHRRGLIPIPSR